MNNVQLIKMSEHLPLPWLLKMSIYNVIFGDDAVITRVVDRVNVMSHGISELRSELNSSPNQKIVGIDVVNNGDLLLFYVKKRCLIVQYKRMMSLDCQSLIPSSLDQFMQDTNITFVGTRNIGNNSLTYYNNHIQKFEFEFERVVDVGYFGAKILKKPKHLTGKLEELIVDAGLDIKRPIINNNGEAMRPGWQSSSVLSDEEVRYAMYEVHSCYQIVIALLDVMGASTVGQQPLDLKQEQI